MSVPHSARHRKGWSHVVGSRAETALQKFAWSWNVFRVCKRRAEEKAERRKRKKLGMERASRRPTRAHVPSGRTEMRPFQQVPNGRGYLPRSWHSMCSSHKNEI